MEGVGDFSVLPLQSKPLEPNLLVQSSDLRLETLDLSIFKQTGLGGGKRKNGLKSKKKMKQKKSRKASKQNRIDEKGNRRHLLAPTP